MSHIGNDAWYERQNDSFLETYEPLIDAMATYHQVMAGQSDMSERDAEFNIINKATKVFPEWKKLSPLKIVENAHEFYEDYLESGRFHNGKYKSKKGSEILPKFFEME